MMRSPTSRGFAFIAAASLAAVQSPSCAVEAALSKPLQPLRGWNSYDAFGVTNETATLAIVDGLVSSGLLAAGYSYVTLDEGWFGHPTLRIDEWGRPVGSAQLYPSAAADGSLKPLSDAVHAKGLYFGLWYMAGVPRASFDSNSPIKDTNFTVRWSSWSRSWSWSWSSILSAPFRLCPALSQTNEWLRVVVLLVLTRTLHKLVVGDARNGTQVRDIALNETYCPRWDASWGYAVNHSHPAAQAWYVYTLVGVSQSRSPATGCSLDAVNDVDDGDDTSDDS